MSTYELQRLEKIKRNAGLLKELGLDAKLKPSSHDARPSKKRKLNQFDAPRPTRSSSRIAASERPSYSDEKVSTTPIPSSRSNNPRKKTTRSKNSPPPQTTKDEPIDASIAGVEEIRAGWTDWKAEAPSPTRDTHGAFRFPDHADFTPNKSPEEILREGCFGGSYFRPLYSRHLGITVSDDWKELPSSWVAGLNVERVLANPEYDAEVNKFGVACGQSIEEWEASGWINHKYDVRGWFQWYCRFFLGRRCEDDERQISRWKKCVGETGRWRRLLLKKYKAMDVRDVFDDGEDEDSREVSPVMHQTCHHWAFEVKQDILDAFWASER
ncbi:hypothetical protein EV356DRAFT_535452 [Viridothelium virens]|uniref:Vegetatible incompatibility protein HET-E-1 n=1 Tax=Viridothelium virens TaxID=1048519 RepID=A0A6A6H0C4_VIRVR|nr:hypothetical protein EV356DRAFT_535452 [Viridothelium virens]